MDAGSTVAAKAGADAPGGGISLCFCRRGCAAPAYKAATLNVLPRSTSCHAQRPVTLNVLPRSTSCHAQRLAATAAAGGPFSFAATKIRIGCGRSLPQRLLQAKLFSAASIRKSEPEIKNHCTVEGFSRQKPAVIPKLTPSNQESLQCKMRFQAKSCIDSQVWA